MNCNCKFWAANLTILALAFLLSESSAAQTVPPSCDGVTYDCKAIETTPYAYRRIETCGSKPFKESEAVIYQDEVNAWGSVCNLTTERIGWYASTTSVGGCGVATSLPQFSFGLEIRNASHYWWRYHSPACSSPLTERDLNVAWREREVYCPGNWGIYDGGTSGIARCRRQSTNVDPDKSLGKPKGKCCGNPINTAIANKYQEELDYQSAGIGGLVLKRYYNSGMAWSSNKTDYTVGSLWTSSAALGYGAYVKLAFTEEPNQHKITAIDSIGAQWRHYYQRGIFLNVRPTFVTAMVYRHDGRVVPFNLDSGNYITQGDINDKLIVLADGRFQFTDAEDETVETYLTTGQLETIRHKNGLLHTVAYDSCMRIATVTDQFGHSLQFNYQHTCSDPNKEYRITSVTVPGGGTISYAYNTSDGTLTSVTYPDLSTRGYTYGGSDGRRLTGITDEAGVAFASWTYNTAGQPITSQHAGGAGAVTIDWGGVLGYWAPTRATITDSLGTVTVHNYIAKRGLNLISSVERPHPSGTGIMDEVWTYDANGNVATYSNNRNYRTNYVFDLTRNLETSRTEGLNNNGTTNPETRTITTQWHPTFRLPALITESGRTTAFTYDANGNRLTKTITDTATSATRVWTWTYDSYGRMRTADGPRTDVADITTYTYYTCTTGYQCGQLQTITDAAFHVTTFNTYNVHGQPLTITDPNGVVTTLGYDTRQRLASRAIGSEATIFEYWPTGLLKKVTLPDSSFLLYTYDAAHRLTRIDDGTGNYVVYTLDDMGNRTAENVYDPTSFLTRTHSRVINSLNQVWKDLTAAGTVAQTTVFGYDNNGNQTTINAPLTRNTTNQYDALDRLKQVTDPASGITQFGYDATDNLTSVTDPGTKVTSYTYTGFGDLKTKTSPDTGLTTNTYDSGGNLQTSTDARNAITTYTLDALNRVASAAFKIGTTTDQTISFGYDAGLNGIGRLTSASDANHSMSWVYSAQGSVTSKSQTVGTVTRTVGYGYTNGNLTSMTTPSGKSVVYGYNSNHQITSVSVNGTTVLSAVLYDPFGPVRGWTWGNGTFAVRTYDLDGKITQLDSAGLKTYAYDDAFRITGITDTVTPANSWTYGYDLLDRLTSGVKTGTTRGWSYDANGNRLTETGAAASTYTISTTNNRISSISGALPRTYSYDPAGNVLSYATVTATYNNRGRMKTLKKGTVTASYVYNALGQFVKQSGGPSGTVLYVYDEAGHILGEYTSTGALVQETIWMGDTPVASIRPGTPSLYYVHTDHLNTPRRVTRPSDNKLMWSWYSDPFGTDLPNENPAAGGTFKYNLRFPGQLYDSHAGLNQNMMRDYDPAVGRYVESDPIGQRLYFSLSNISGVSQRHRGYWNHLYNYGDNLPTMIRDPSGMGELFDWLWDLFKEKTPEAVATKGLAVGFGTLCITKNCGKSRDWVDLYADCASILNDWMKRAGAVGTGAVSGITGDGGQAVISECADLCEKGIKSSSCCNGVKQ